MQNFIQIPDSEEDSIMNSCWMDLEIDNHHGDCFIEILTCSHGGIWFFWNLRDKASYEQDFGELIALDRLFETRGQALDDALEFIQYHVIPYGYKEID